MRNTVSNRVQKIKMSRPAVFTLCETISGVFAEICDGYSIDSAFLSWQFERGVWTGKTSPIRISTNDPQQKRPMKEGVEKVTFEIEFDTENPNDIKCIRFTEFPSKKVYLVTQTSIDHVREGTKCPLWVELPPAARKEDIGAVVALLRVDICCDDWKDSLRKEPYTALERAHLVVANEDKFWLKKQVVHKDLASRVMSIALETKIAEIDELKKEVERLQRELEKKKVAQVAQVAPAVETPSPPRKKARKIATPKTQTPKKIMAAPNTAPAKTNGYESRHLVPAQTPTKARVAAQRGFVVDDGDDDILY